MSITLKLAILDSIFDLRGQSFDCITVMNYIRENEANNKTIPHQEIAMYLDSLLSKGWIKVADRSCDFTKYKMV